MATQKYPNGEDRSNRVDDDDDISGKNPGWANRGVVEDDTICDGPTAPLGKLYGANGGSTVEQQPPSANPPPPQKLYGANGESINQTRSGRSSDPYD